MLKKFGRLGIVAVVVAVPLLTIVWLTLFSSEVGMAIDIGIKNPRLSECDYSSVPQSVIDDAVEMATKFVGDSQEKLQEFVDQLVATYMEAQNSDVVVFFNSGGWGWNNTDETPGWASIIEGIKSQLEGLGYHPLVLNYRRTSSGITGCIREFSEAVTRYPHKSRELAERVEFLTDHLPDLRVIVAGESTGTVISDKTMGILKDKPQVFSIQTGTPFWHKPATLDRTLLMNSNGKGIDTFSYGNIPAMIWATIKGWFGLTSPDDNPGDILSWLKAPGHDYSWQYPGVCSEVIRFLDENFGEKD
jgi:hypothetical protein